MVTIILHPHFITLLSSPSCPQPPIPLLFSAFCPQPSVFSLLFSPSYPHLYPPIITPALTLMSSPSCSHLSVLTLLSSPFCPHSSPSCPHSPILTLQFSPFCPHLPIPVFALLSFCPYSYLLNHSVITLMYSPSVPSLSVLTLLSSPHCPHSDWITPHSQNLYCTALC